MSQDALLLAAIRDELADLLVGGRVQRVVRPSEMSIGLEVYAGVRHQLLLDSASDGVGIGLQAERLRRGVETASPLQLLLRKHVEGARLTSVTQPGLERLLRFSFQGEHGAVDLVCEIMGRLGNLILVGEDGVILDAAHRVPARVNRYRTILPGSPYLPPPPQDRAQWNELDDERLAAALTAQQGSLHSRLVRAVAGMSPLLAREICHRAGFDDDTRWPISRDASTLLFACLRELMGLSETHAWQPSVGYQTQQGQAVAVAVAPYPLTHCDRWEAVTSVSQAALIPLGTAQQRDAYAGARVQALDLVHESVARLEARCAALERALVTRVELEELRLRGEAILAHAWGIAPGQADLVCTRGEVTGEMGEAGQVEMRIRLDPALSPAENAQAVFRSYRKRQAAREQVPGRLEQARADLAYVQQLAADVELAQNREEIEAALTALHEGGFKVDSNARRAPVRAVRAAPLEVRGPGGMPIVVGRNSTQNEQATFRIASAADLWLHARGVPGAHVVIRNGGADVDERDLLCAAGLAAYYSGARHDALVPVDFTERRNVRRMPGGRPGMVYYRGESTLQIRPMSEQELSPGTPGD